MCFPVPAYGPRAAPPGPPAEASEAQDRPADNERDSAAVDAEDEVERGEAALPAVAVETDEVADAADRREAEEASDAESLSLGPVVAEVVVAPPALHVL